MTEAVNKTMRVPRQLLQESGAILPLKIWRRDFNCLSAKSRRILRSAEEPVRLETQADGEDKGILVSDLCRDEFNLSPLENLISQDIREQTARVLKTMKPREEQIIKMRFGLVDGSEQTLEEIGQRFRLTRERIRQIEAKALRKLRHPARSNRLLALWCVGHTAADDAQDDEEINDDSQ